MALSGFTTIGQQGLGSTVRMTNKARIQFDLDGNYIDGGYATFAATFVKAATLLGSKVTVVDIQQAGPANDGATFYDLVYDRANDKLMVLTGGAQVAGGADLSGVLNVEMTVEYI